MFDIRRVLVGSAKPYVPQFARAWDKRDLKDAKVVLIDAGHFALETKVHEIAGEVRRFLGERGC